MARLLAALLILGGTAVAIHAIAVRKNEELAGPGVYRLDQDRPEAIAALDELLEELEWFGEHELAGRLEAVQGSGQLWVAPYIPEGRQALWIESLGLVERIYVARDALLVREPPFPELNLPESWRLVYGQVRLAGTLFHELDHLDGELDEAEVYRREAGWYGQLLDSASFDELHEEDKGMYRWAIESAILSAEQAAGRAGAD